MRHIISICVFLCALACAFFAFSRDDQQDRAVPVSTDFPAIRRRILLIPLDSRPPCGRFVQDAGRIAGVEVVLPPAELLDEYFRPGDTAALQSWTMEHIAGFDAAILSIDQLLHGGLIASRQAKKTIADEEDLLDFLYRLRAAHPNIPLYAFSILPRMTPPDGLVDWEEQKRLMKYSRLLGRLAREKNPRDEDLSALDDLRASISAENLAQYERLFANYADFGQRLISLAENGTLDRLVIGQDDSEPNSIPNLVLHKFSELLAAKGISENRVFLAQGADELALSILAADEAQRNGFSPRVALIYNDSSTPDRVLPYMGATLEKTAREKIRFTRGTIAASPETADFTLYISANDKATANTRKAAAATINTLLDNKRTVALVDLAEHLRLDETLLPVLVENKTPIHMLAAYAGWNTASNSVGTAVAHAVLLQIAQRRAQTENDALSVAAAHISFLDGRFLEDCYYLKDVVDHLNYSLEKCGAQNGRGLEYNYNYPLGSLLLETAIENRRTRLVHTAAYQTPFTFKTENATLLLRATDFTATARFPWPRTFEIDLRINNLRLYRED
ncbi:MAG: DUF4127 family protein [Schwartzia sp.]|nr:DUF4127 family protein [Schwartzia sp. (in: firmicutes)]